MKNCNITLLCAALASLCAVSTFAAKPQTDQTSRLPNIDRIAKEGILFTDGHAGASTCTPTRYGFMTAGVILESLERLDIDDNTLVIFTSDNGGCPRQFNGHYPMGPILRGGKGDLVEGGTRVPFVARWPGKIKPGTVSKEIVSTTDMMATFAAITGKELPKGAGPDSYNVLSAFQGKALPDPNRPIVFVSGGTGALSIRAGKWKLIEGQSWLRRIPPQAALAGPQTRRPPGPALQPRGRSRRSEQPIQPAFRNRPPPEGGTGEDQGGGELQSDCAGTAKRETHHQTGEAQSGSDLTRSRRQAGRHEQARSGLCPVGSVQHAGLRQGRAGEERR
jgi:hypothetical protein